MDIVAKVAPYFWHPLVLVGLVMLVAVLSVRQLSESGVIRAFPDSSPFRALKLSHGLLIGLVLVGAGAYLKHAELRADTSVKVAGQSERNGMLGEVDYGFVELDPGQPTPIPSYKNGGNMVLYAGEEFRFQALADGPLPAIELRTGDGVQLLPGPDGKVTVIGPSNQPLSAVLSAQGSRISLPGGAPPRISVKVQVFGTARPK